MNVRRQLRTALESVLVCAAFALIPWWPRRVVVAAAHGLGSLAYAASRRLRRVALANLEIAYGEALSARDRRRIAVRSLRNLTLVVLDFFWFGVFVRRRIERYVSFDASVDPCFDLKPAIYVTGHLGNWEVAGQAMALRGVPLLSVAARIKSPVVEFVVNRARRQTGQRIVHNRGALRGVVHCLRQGGRVAMLMDQNTTPRRGGVFVSFFGLPVPVSDAAALLCARTGARLIVVACVPDGLGYRVWATPPEVVGGAGGLKAEDATQRLTNHLEALVRRFPHCWAWGYKRWKFVPPGEDIARYPFYAQHYTSETIA